MKAAIRLVFAFSFTTYTVHCSAQENSGNTIVTHPSKKFKSNFYKPKSFSRSILLPAGFVGYGFLSLENKQLQQINYSIRGEIKEDLPQFNTKTDDVLKYAPAASVYLLNLAGVKGKHRMLERTTLLLVSNMLSQRLVNSLKHATHQLRPDGTTYNSFPSGHTSVAFTGAEFMNQEFGQRSIWYSVAGYSMATATALLRMMNNRHWLSDVITGAGIGMLSTKLTYWIYEKWEFNKKPNTPLYY